MNESFEKQIGLAFLLTFLAMKKVRDKFLFISALNLMIAVLYYSSVNLISFHVYFVENEYVLANRNLKSRNKYFLSQFIGFYT
jgi:hypothetical protein